MTNLRLFYTFILECVEDIIAACALSPRHHGMSRMFFMHVSMMLGNGASNSVCRAVAAVLEGTRENLRKRTHSGSITGNEGE
jgi:hypothetical protein